VHNESGKIMNNKTLLVLISCITFLSGCAAPGHVKEKASTLLTPFCYKMFTDTGLGSYQHCNIQVASKCAFVISQDVNENQVCSYTNGNIELRDDLCLFDCNPTWAQVEAVALTKCEEYKKKNNATNYGVCKIFAKQNEIIWEDYKKTDVKFQ
jgi:hypothetical protein